MEVLPCELVIKFSDYFNYFPQVNGNWNCGFTILNNGYHFLCRNEVSKWNENYFNRKLETWYPRAVPVHAHFDFSFNLLSVNEIVKTNNLILSDVRALNWQDQLYATGTWRSNKYQVDGKRRVDQFFGKIIGDKLLYIPFEHNYPLPQKNWTPLILKDRIVWENFEQKNQLRRNLMAHVRGELKIVYSELVKHQLRGNCQSVDMGDFLLTTAHFHKRRYYYHYFLLKSKEWPYSNILLSKPFRFSLGNSEKEHIQFLMGMERYRDGLLLSYGVQDSDNYLVFAKIQDIMNLFNKNSLQLVKWV